MHAPYGYLVHGVINEKYNNQQIVASPQREFPTTVITDWRPSRKTPDRLSALRQPMNTSYVQRTTVHSTTVVRLRQLPTDTLFIKRDRVGLYPVPYLYQLRTDLMSVCRFKLELWIDN